MAELSDSLHPLITGSSSGPGGTSAPPVLPAEALPVHFTCEEMERLLAPMGLQHFSPLAGGKDGGMSHVFECLDTEMNQRRVVKIPNRLDEITCERFACEAEILTKITDRRIVRLYRYGKAKVERADGRVFQLPYCVMEFVEGRSMEACLTTTPGRGQPPRLDHPRFSLKDKLRVAIECCLAMQAAHTQGEGILHRDLKPSNIMIVGFDDSLSVRIIDFGIGYLPGTSSGHTRQATDYYAAPEQRSHEGAITICTDVYLLGGTLHDWFAGRGDASQRWPSDLPPLLEKVLKKATAKQQHERHQSMAELRAELEEILGWVREVERHPLPSLEEEARQVESSRPWLERLAYRRMLIWAVPAAAAAASLPWLGWVEMVLVTAALVLLLLPRLRLFRLRVAAAGLLLFITLAQHRDWFGSGLEEKRLRWENTLAKPQRVRVELAGVQLAHLAKTESFINKLVVECSLVINGETKHLRSMLVPQAQLPDTWLNKNPGTWPSAVDVNSHFAVVFEDVVPKTAFVELREGRLIDDELFDDDLGSFSFTQALVSLRDGGLVSAATVGGDAGGRYSGSTLTFRVSVLEDDKWVPLDAPE